MKEQLRLFIERCMTLREQHWGRHGYTHQSGPEPLEIQSGGRTFARIVAKGYGVYCFVALKDGSNKKLGTFKAGEVFKADGWAGPAKHARGHIDEENVGRFMTEYGAAYR